MNISKALVSGVLIAAFVSFMLVMAGFFFGVSMNIPGFLTLKSAGGNNPQANIHFYPYTPVALAVVITGIIWTIGWMRDRRKQERP